MRLKAILKLKRIGARHILKNIVHGQLPHQYKANRVVDPEMEVIFTVLNAFREITTLHTSIITLSVPGAEADDVIGIFCQEHANENDEIFIVSGDKDFTQLLNLPNVYLVNPDDGKLRNQPGDKIYYDDIDFFMFEKCVRGDKGDNVFSAYPRVRINKIKQAYEDPYERANFMNTTWSVENDDGSKTVYRVGDLFEENKLLMDLRMQPKEVRDDVIAAINNAVANPGKYSNFHFMKFIGQYKLQVLSDKLSQFTDMFSQNQTIINKNMETPSQKKQEVVSNSLLSF